MDAARREEDKFHRRAVAADLGEIIFKGNPGKLPGVQEKISDTVLNTNAVKWKVLRDLVERDEQRKVMNGFDKIPELTDEQVSQALKVFPADYWKLNFYTCRE